MLTDLDEAGLLNYRSDVVDPADFDAFWEQQLQRVAAYPIDVRVTPVDTMLSTVEVFDVEFAGFDAHPIRAWLYLPKHRIAPLPGVVQFQGYGGGRGHHLEQLLWSAAGYAHLMMDNRGQGASYRAGATADPVGPSGSSIPGEMTNGIENPAGHYYTRLYIDAVRAVDALQSIEEVDARRIAVVGGSQGGALALAVGALRDDIAAVVAHVPFMSDIRRASRITDAAPYKEIGRYLATHRNAVNRVFATLAYFDGVSLARRITAPTWLSAALMDPTCPPSTVFGVYKELQGTADLHLWEYNGHEGGGADDDERALRALHSVFDASDK